MHSFEILDSYLKLAQLLICSLTYIEILIFSFLLYNHWRPSWILASTAFSTGGKIAESLFL